MQSGQECPCSMNQLGNGICDERCDISECDWDGGDCKSSNSSTIITWVIIITAILFFLIATAIIIYRMKQHKRRNSRVSPEIMEKYEYVSKFTKNALASISVHTENDAYSDNNMCVICLGNLQNGDIKLITNCSHEYHAECINQWLEISSKKWCPCCKQSI